MNRIVVAGASAAGLTACETLRREGFEGTLTLIGDELSLPYDRPPLSKQILSSQWEPERLMLRTEAQLAALDLDFRLGVRATGLDVAARTVRLDDGTAVSYDGLIVATGVRPRALAGSGAHFLRTVGDALELRKCLRPGTRLTIVGAGFLGAESAAVARGIGCEVVLLEPAPVPLAHAVGVEVGRFLSEIHRSAGVDLRTGVAVSEVVDEGVVLAGGELVASDEVLVAVGSVPNTEWLADSGLEIGDGLVGDAFCRAGPDIYAAGDVARWHNPVFGESMRIEHRTNAAEQGMAAARNLLGAGKPFAPVPYFWSDQYDLKIHAYGYLRGHEEVEIVDGALAERRFLAVYRRGSRVVGALAAGMPPKAIRPWRQAILAAS
ncbi:NADPH-dependent 2,4-dienoyl-CoA reductase/sulfur reductase-like enzyme [Actinoplanes lutulentus]|uniref:NADPH-dependent 2,4-dienoyl-CoA reductase/sulfur reductase-like enzyme n=1 Tax=Actinoplanes lutulentus TaxID=1287878 RepID=A0A327Z4L3_9ACTN|nr:FAD-dependent oxidoreductase [Actinoplanes lutulentus]MBB2947074.1 NADPH-dependent 2,4-dienoyl-CoA reductase/sulfur reductase-like enzyme [Actinoplanes lutulentus]RAK30571.1 NADPH-dependent 2,4-dienoyl-CoA reductase/sulfur reductase-like enzyme [Actinoplanes lutulentus]